MSIERRTTIFGISIGRKEISANTKEVLEKRHGKPTQILEVLSPTSVRYHTYIKLGKERFPIIYENNDPEELNKMNIKSSSRILKRIYTWKP